jgi:hypothetical protein
MAVSPQTDLVARYVERSRQPHAVELRHFDGRLFRPVRDAAGGDGQVPCSGPGRMSLPRAPGLDPTLKVMPAPLPDTSGIRTVVSSRREETLALLLKWAGELLVIDSVMWMRVPEPALLLDMDTDTVLFCDSPGPSAFAGRSLYPFRLDEIALAATWPATARPRRRVVSPQIQVFAPDLLRFQAVEWRLLNAGRNLLRYMNGIVKLVPPPVRLSYEGARRALADEVSRRAGSAEGDETLDSEFVSVLETAATVLAANLAAIGSQSVDRMDEKEHGKAVMETRLSLKICAASLSDWSASLTPPDDAAMFAADF